MPNMAARMIDLGQLLGGVTVIEAVFNYRGIGNMMFEAVKARDYPLLQGGFLLFTITILILNIITEFIYNQSQEKKRIVIAGSHGKTSITSMILHVLKANQVDFDYLVGAQIEGFELMVRLSGMHS